MKSKNLLKFTMTFLVVVLGCFSFFSSTYQVAGTASLETKVLEPKIDYMMLSNNLYVIVSNEFLVEKDVCKEVEELLTEIQFKSLDFVYARSLLQDEYQMYDEKELAVADARDTYCERQMDNAVIAVNMHDQRCLDKIHQHKMFEVYQIDPKEMYELPYPKNIVEHFLKQYNARFSVVSKLWNTPNKLEEYLDKEVSHKEVLRTLK